MGIYRRCNRDPSRLQDPAFRRTLWHRVLAAQPNWGDGTSAYRGYGVDGHPSPWNVRVGRRFAQAAAEGLRVAGLPRYPIPQTSAGLQEWGQAVIRALRQALGDPASDWAPLRAALHEIWHRILAAQPEWGNGASCFRGQNTDGRPACWNVTIGRKFAGQALQGLRSVGLPVRTIPLTRTGLQEWGQAALGDLRQVAALAGIDTASAS
mgnify:CR=1 FL=1